MEHFKSTIATAAISAFGLYAAAHILHPGNFERTTYPSRPVAAVATPASAWVSPPATPVAPAVKADASEILPSPVAWTSANAAAPARTTELAPEPRRTAKASRKRMSQRRAPMREAALGRPVQAPAAAQTAPRNRIDPIGDIIRGLGLDSDS